jgi:hypothetical protein
MNRPMAAKAFPPEFGRDSQMIEIELLEKRFNTRSGEVVVTLTGVSLSVADGEFVSVVHAVLEARTAYRSANRKPAHAHV